MLFFVTGANGSGKTSCLPVLSRLLPDFKVHDFAEVGVPDHVDAIWRQETTQYWISTYVVQYHPKGQHVVVSGEAVFGEVHAIGPAGALYHHQQPCRYAMVAMEHLPAR